MVYLKRGVVRLGNRLPSTVGSWNILSKNDAPTKCPMIPGMAPWIGRRPNKAERCEKWGSKGMILANSLGSKNEFAVSGCEPGLAPTVKGQMRRGGSSFTSFPSVLVKQARM
jgi:hypothetical protein